MASITSQWWRRLVNAYEVMVGMVCLQCKHCVIHARGEFFTMRRYTNLSAFTFSVLCSVYNSIRHLEA